MNHGSERDGRNTRIDDRTSPNQGKVCDVVCIGWVMVDVLFSGLPRLPELGQEYCTRRYSVDAGGGAAITAVALSKLGCGVTLAATVGNDPFGSFFRERVAAHAVDVSCLFVACDKPTALSMELSFPSNRATVTCDPEYDDVADRESVREHVLASRHLHVGRLTPGRVELLRLAATSGLTTSVDTKLTIAGQEQLLRSAAPHIDFFMPNQDEVSGDNASVSARARELGRLVRKFCVVKQGDKGAIASDGETLVQSDAFRATALDTTGAGDAFNAGFLYAFLKGHSIDQCLMTGNAAGALSIQAIGGVAGALRLGQLRQYMIAQGISCVP